MHSYAMNESRLQRLLACLGDPSRFRVLSVLVEGDRCVTEIAVRVRLSQSCTTRHLQTLQREGVVSRVRSGKRVFFRIVQSDPLVTRILEWALLRGSPEARPSAPVASRSPVAESAATATRDAADAEARRSVLPVAERRCRATGSPSPYLVNGVTGYPGRAPTSRVPNRKVAPPAEDGTLPMSVSAGPEPLIAGRSPDLAGQGETAGGPVYQDELEDYLL